MRQLARDAGPEADSSLQAVSKKTNRAQKVSMKQKVTFLVSSTARNKKQTCYSLSQGPVPTAQPG